MRLTNKRPRPYRIFKNILHDDSDFEISLRATSVYSMSSDDMSVKINGLFEQVPIYSILKSTELVHKGVLKLFTPGRIHFYFETTRKILTHNTRVNFQPIRMVVSTISSRTFFSTTPYFSELLNETFQPPELHNKQQITLFRSLKRTQQQKFVLSLSLSEKRIM